MGVYGVVEKQHFNKHFGEYRKAILDGKSEKEIDRLYKKAIKKQFKANGLWEIIHHYLNVDVRIPFVTGYWTDKVVTHNLITTRGKQIIAAQLGGSTTAPIVAIALGTGTAAPNATDTALGTESLTATAAIGRKSSTNTYITTTTTSDTVQFATTFGSATASVAVTEEGLFDTATATTGNMLARQTFAAVNMVSGDTLAITHKVQFT